MMECRHRLSLCAVAILIGIAAPARAQVTAAVGLVGGYYRPFGHFDPASVYDTSLPNEPSDLSGFSGGGVVHLSVGRRFGLEAQLSDARSTIPEVETPGGSRGPTQASVEIGMLVGEYDLSPTPQRYRLWLNAGPAVVRHGGDAYAPFGSPTSAGGAAGLGLTVPIARQIQFAANLTTIWYVFNLAMPAAGRENPGPLEHGAQRDALLQVGLRWGHP
jgi:hypothetical protein